MTKGQQVLELAAKGLTARQIGERVGWHPNNVFKALSDAGIKAASDRDLFDWTPERIERAKELRAEGLSFTQIGQALGTTKNTVVGRFRRLGLIQGGRRGDFDWTDQAIDTLRTMWAGGNSATEIARALHNPSRNSVIGKLKRLGLLNSDLPPRVTSAKYRRTLPAVARVPRLRPVPTAPPRVTLRPEPALAPECAPVTLLDRANGQCCWPVGEVRGPATLYCGAPKQNADRPYCAFHRQRSVVQRSAA